MALRPNRICEVCGTEFYKRPGRIAANQTHCCSHKCNGILQRTSIEKACEICGKKFSIIPSRIAKGKGRFCSQECMGISTRGNGSSNWQGGRMIPCEVCGKKFYVGPAKCERGHGRFCSHKCRGLGLMGERSVNWNGGTSFEPYPPEFNEHFRQMILERDDCICAVCRLSGDSIHHINYIKDDTISENCITLCRNCHGATGGNREYWTVALGNLMEVRGYVAY